MKSSVIVSLVLPAALAISPSPISYIPLSANQGLTVQSGESLYEHVKQMYSRHGVQLDDEVDDAIEKRSEVLLYHENASKFTGQIKVGNPPQAFNVILDTGSTDLVIAGDLCMNCAFETPFYVPGSSNTSKVSTTINTVTYGTGSIAGVLIQDKVSIGGTIFPNSVFTSCSSMKGGMTSSKTSGILGMGVGASPKSNVYPLIESLAMEGYLKSEVFAFAFEQYNYITQPEPKVDQGGVMMVGGLNTSYYSGSINWIPINGARTSPYWQIPLDDISVAGKSLGISADFAVVDTGTSVVAGTYAAVNAIYAQIPGSKFTQLRNGFALWAYPCNSTTTVALKFGGVSYPIAASAMAFGFDEGDPTNSTCIGSIVTTQLASNPTLATLPWIIGDSFLTSVFNAYRISDPKAVGFASLGSGGIVSSFANNTFSPKSSAIRTASIDLFGTYWIVALTFAVGSLIF